jgi:hypothetical protein
VLPTTSGDEKIDPTLDCFAVPTSGASRQFEGNSIGMLKRRSAVSTQPALRFDASVSNCHSTLPLARSRASSVPLSTPT